MPLKGHSHCVRRRMRRDVGHVQKYAEIERVSAFHDVRRRALCECRRYFARVRLERPPYVRTTTRRRTQCERPFSQPANTCDVVADTC